MTPAQCRAARALIDMTVTGLARIAVVPVSAVMDFERGKSMPNQRNLNTMAKALERAGVEFIDDIGVKLKAPQS
jgi:transcriptional regulator with XRE-family HTH domain